MSVTVSILGQEDAHVLTRVAPDVFDGPLRDDLVREFLGDPRHVIAVAIDETGTVVGMASAFRYVHPDKPHQFFVNEVGVAPPHQGRGVGRRLMRVLLAHAAGIGCREAWVATTEDNAAARALFRKAGGKEAPEAVVLYTYDLDEGRGEDAGRPSEDA